MSSRNTLMGAFNQGDKPIVACFNKATMPLDVGFRAAMQQYVDNHVARVNNGEEVSVSASHEPVEMPVDPAIFAHMGKVNKPFEVLSGGMSTRTETDV